MSYDSARIQLKKFGRIDADGANTGYTWRKRRGDFQMLDENSVHRISHSDRQSFKLKILDYCNGCGEFS